MTDRHTGPGREFGNNLRSLRGWRDADRDVREEMALHVDLRTEELAARGIPRDEARARALREVGALSDVAPAVQELAATTDRQASWRQRLDELAHDVRHGLRVCRRSPAFSAVAVLTIALGVGANAAMFAMVNTLFFQPLPIDRDGRLVRVREFRGIDGGARIQVDASRRTADAVAGRSDLFSASVAVLGTSRALAQDDGALHVQATRVGPHFTAVIGVSPILGRTFTPEEERAGDGAAVVLISHRLWRTVFGGSLDVVGRTVRLDNAPFEVVGVLPSNFHVPYDSEAWFPSRFDENQRSLFILARLADGVALDQANAALEPIGRRLQEAYPDVMHGLGVNAVLARDFFVDRADRVPVALMGAVGFLLLIACANVALLLTARFAARRREVAVRAALGCGRARQIRQFATEAVLLFAAGGALGLVLGAWLKDSLAVFLPDAIATQVGIVGIPFDLGVVGFATLLSAGAGVVFGVVSAARASRADIDVVLKDAGRGLAGDRSRHTLGLLAAGEVALAVVLLTAAAMMTDAFYRLQHRDLGFDPEGLLTVRAELHAERFAAAGARLAFVDRVLERASGLPGVRQAALTTVNPLCCGDWGVRISPEGLPPGPDSQLPIVQHQIVTPGYFDTMRIRIVEGRSFTEADTGGREPVVIVDDRMARRFWPGQRALGKRVKRGPVAGQYPWMTVVGVVATIHDEGEYSEAWYLPYGQHATGPSSPFLHLMIRADGDPAALGGSVRTAVAGLDPALAWHGLQTMNAVRSEALRQNRLGAIVSIVFAAVGLLLSALGLYAVLAYVLAADIREIGVRLALGARPSTVLRLIVGRGLRLSLAGLIAGAGAAVVMARALERLVPDTRFDPGVIAAATAALLVAGALASLVPARRALRIDPLDALRES
jgi:predicted permease